MTGTGGLSRSMFPSPYVPSYCTGFSLKKTQECQDHRQRVLDLMFPSSTGQFAFRSRFGANRLSRDGSRRSSPVLKFDSLYAYMVKHSLLPTHCISLLAVLVCFMERSTALVQRSSFPVSEPTSE